MTTATTPLIVRNDLTAFEAALHCAAANTTPAKAAAKHLLAFEYGWTAGLVSDLMDRAEAFLRLRPEMASTMAKAWEGAIYPAGVDFALDVDNGHYWITDASGQAGRYYLGKANGPEALSDATANLALAMFKAGFRAGATNE